MPNGTQEWGQRRLAETIPRIGIFVSFSGEGGVERMIAHLCEGFLEAGNEVDLLLIKERGSAVSMIPSEVRRFKMGEHASTSLPRLVSYLREHRPSALLSSKHRANQVAIAGRAIARVDTRLLVKIETNLSASLAHQNVLKRWSFASQIRLFYSYCDGVIGVSQGVTECLRQWISNERLPLYTVYNPVLPRRLAEKAQEAVEHPWFRSDGPPVIVAAGRLTPQKDFATLLHAFAKLLCRRDARLLLLGEGPERGRLESLVKSLNLGRSVDLHGFVPNPFKFMAHARLSVLSSVWEGFGNVLVEAMALGVPVVSTDCPSGPREILRDGALGPLVPVGDSSALADAMLARLDAPVDRAALVAATVPYTIEGSAREHLRLLLDQG